VGQVADLAEIFERVRLTVAPVRFGGGVKGKVLASFAAGIPCVMSTQAAEGIALPGNLNGLVGKDAAEIASRIVRLHAGQAANRTAAEAGLALIAGSHDEATVTRALAAAIRASGEAMSPVVQAGRIP
jgi:hypothetical protein